MPEIHLDAITAGWVCTILLAAITVASALLVRAKRKVPIWLTAVFAVVFLIGFLTWAAAGASIHTIPLAGGLFAGALSLSVPLIFGSLCGVLSERVGVVNIAIEGGQLLAGAFTSAVIATSVAASTGAGLARPSRRHHRGVGRGRARVVRARGVLDQVLRRPGHRGRRAQRARARSHELLLLAGAVLERGGPQLAAALPAAAIPILSDIPLIGPTFFRQTIIVYLVYVAVALVYFGLFHTKWGGLRLRSVGEHPQAADTVGINVARTRFWNVSLGGAIAGIGGAFFTLGSVGAFNREMTAGAGFIALAAVIFGQWDPIKATLAALLFGFASNLQNILGVIGSAVPSEFLLMLPYVITIFAVAGLVGKVRGPAAAGKPYIKA